MRSFRRRLFVEALERRALLATVHWGADAAPTDQGQWIVPLEIDDAAGVRAADVRIKYNSADFVVRPQDVTAGAVWAGRGVSLARVDEAAGEISIFMFSAEGLPAAAGSLIDVALTPRHSSHDLPKLSLEKSRLNEGQIDVSLGSPRETDERILDAAIESLAPSAGSLSEISAGSTVSDVTMGPLKLEVETSEATEQLIAEESPIAAPAIDSTLAQFDFRPIDLFCFGLSKRRASA